MPVRQHVERRGVLATFDDDLGGPPVRAVLGQRKVVEEVNIVALSATSVRKHDKERPLFSSGRAVGDVPCPWSLA